MWPTCSSRAGWSDRKADGSFTLAGRRGTRSKPVLGKLVSVHGAYEATSFGAESENQVRMAFEPDEPRGRHVVLALL
jgi:hypothetical protein